MYRLLCPLQRVVLPDFLSCSAFDTDSVFPTSGKDVLYYSVSLCVVSTLFVRESCRCVWISMIKTLVGSKGGSTADGTDSSNFILEITCLIHALRTTQKPKKAFHFPTAQTRYIVSDIMCQLCIAVHKGPVKVHLSFEFRREHVSLSKLKMPEEHKVYISADNHFAPLSAGYQKKQNGGIPSAMLTFLLFKNAPPGATGFHSSYDSSCISSNRSKHPREQKRAVFLRRKSHA